ncbi:unnamed protein product [Schistosoma margrebowiei]|uniref:Uncharacterized protein n=1 Tax=Schistosoma margrebowiei TaxID=48269 RepID=A0A183M9R3_9TREM|nr:unnamed protein product [Schistosoma margrebowiei]
MNIYSNTTGRVKAYGVLSSDSLTPGGVRRGCLPYTSDRLAKKYWEKLFKEYCLIDLSRYKENKFGMRWRLEKEVISGKGMHCIVCL